MSLRKAGRDAIRNAIYTFGIVESVHNGLVTVRLGDSNGPRLTNLRLIGEYAEKGQRVRVDYSSGAPPSVHSALKADVEELELEVGVSVSDNPGGDSASISRMPDNDFSCHVFQDWWPLETQYNEEPGTWYVFKFGGNGWAIPGYTGWDIYPYPDPIHWEYDNAEFIDKVEYYTTEIVIPITGKYLVTAQINPYDVVSLATAFEFRLKKNGTIIGEKSFGGAFNAIATNVNIYALHVLEPFDAGDILTMEYYWTYDHQLYNKSDVTWYNSGNWSNRQFVTLNLWPGTG